MEEESQKVENIVQDISIQRETTLKWASNGELTADDMARVMKQLTNPNLTECDLTCDMNNDDSKKKNTYE